MTFRAAYRDLDGPRYRRMRECGHSPLHVQPIVEDGRLVGYEHRSQMHVKNDEWVMDLVKSRSRYATLSGNRLRLRPGVSAWQGFSRDLCALFENVFFAAGCGQTIDEGVLSILRAAQHGRDVDRYAVFGYPADGTADGRTGSYLELTGDHARAFVAWTQRMPSVLASQAWKGQPPMTTALGQC